MSSFQTSCRRFFLAAAIATTVSFMVSGPAEGTDADTGSPESSNLYLRAGLALDWSQDARFMDRDCSAPRPGHFYGCGPGVDGARYSSPGDFGTMIGLELGIGYIASPALRIEATAQHRPAFSFEGRHNYSRRDPRTVSADASLLSGMLSAYLDLPGLGTPRIGSFSPFVGAGIGVARIDMDEMRLNFPSTFVMLPGSRRTNFTWMLAVGLATSLGERTSLDLAWRYTDSGTVETGRGTGRTICRIEGCGLASDYKIPETRADLRSHGLHASVRYAF